ncbi:MAG: DcaP family trimeric outer membrane transporter [Thiohalophilus sp.]
MLCTLLAASAGHAVAAEGKTDYDFYGFIQLDAIYDFNRMNSAWKDSLRPSQICSGTVGCGTDGESILSVRQTRFGVATTTPTDLGELKTKLEFELYGVGSDEGKTTPRLRHAYGEIGSFLAGQTWSTFMDIDVFPNTIEYWGPPSMIFWRNIQVRWTPMRDKNSSFAVALESPSSAIDDGKLSGISPSLSFSGKTDFPDVTAHWRTDGDWGHLQIGGLLRSVGYENLASADGEPSGNKTGYGINLSGSYKLSDNGTIKAQLAYGEAIASYFNDGGIDLAPGAGGQAETLPILGWLLFYDHTWNDQWSSSFGWAMTDQDNSAGQTGTAFKSNQYGVVNLLHYPTKATMVGGELQYGEYEQLDGTTRDDTRMQVSFKFKF